MTLEEKAKQYAENNNYNPYAFGEVQRHFDIGLKKGFMAGYNAAKEENEWKPIESRPDCGRTIIHRHIDFWGTYCYQIIFIDSHKNIPTGGYEWKYID